MRTRVKHTITLFIGVALFSGLAMAEKQIVRTPSVSEKEVMGTIKDEFSIHKAHLQAKMTEHQRRLKGLNDREKQVKRELVQLAIKERKVLQAFLEYAKLLENRYVDRDGVYKPGANLISRDVANMNRFFVGYLLKTPFTGRVSAGRAISTLESGRANLEKQIAEHEVANVENSSEIEIIYRDRFETEREIAILHARAGRLNYKLNTSAGGTSERGLASEAKKTKKK